MNSAIVSFDNALDVPRLYCVPSSGGGASMFRGWRKRLAGSFDVRLYQPPGRETRFHELAHPSISAMAAELLAAIAGDIADGTDGGTDGGADGTDGGYVLFGHSLGALVAFDAARQARQQGRPGPARLVVSACAAPHRFQSEPLVRAGQSDAGCVELLRELGGTPAEVLSHPEMLELILPPLRDDLAMLIGYRYQEEPPLDLPLLILGGNRDTLVRGDELVAWAEQTTAGSRIEVLDGGHFYLAQNERFFDVLAAG